MRTLTTAIVTFLLFTAPALAAQVDVGGGLALGISLKGNWTLALEPPQALVAEAAEHMAHDAAAKGASPTKEQLMQAARQRLAANQAIIYHATEPAHLDIDFSPLDPGQKPPSSKVLENSARYAGESLSDEDELSEIVWEVAPQKIRGARDAYALTAEYRQHGEPVRFLGVIGFAGGQWFFLYYTDRSQKPEVYREMQEMIDSVVIRTTGS